MPPRSRANAIGRKADAPDETAPRSGDGERSRHERFEFGRRTESHAGRAYRPASEPVAAFLAAQCRLGGRKWLRQSLKRSSFSVLRSDALHGSTPLTRRTPASTRRIRDDSLFHDLSKSPSGLHVPANRPGLARDSRRERFRVPSASDWPTEVQIAKDSDLRRAVNRFGQEFARVLATNRSAPR